jgi:hypothetical protein
MLPWIALIAVGLALALVGAVASVVVLLWRGAGVIAARVGRGRIDLVVVRPVELRPARSLRAPRLRVAAPRLSFSRDKAG